MVAKEDPLARMRAFVTEKPEQLKAQLAEWTATQPAWVEGLVQGVTGSFQVRPGVWGIKGRAVGRRLTGRELGGPANCGAVGRACVKKRTAVDCGA